jgi:glutathione S-transferase
MASVALVASLMLLVYIGIFLGVGRARATYKVEAPAVTGHPIFERHFRVQQNTVEQLVLFFPALFLFAQFVNAEGAAILGLIFVAGRVLYAIGYVKDPARRGPGFLISALANLVLVLGSFGGSIRALLAG